MKKIHYYSELFTSLLNEQLAWRYLIHFLGQLRMHRPSAEELYQLQTFVRFLQTGRPAAHRHDEEKKENIEDVFLRAPEDIRDSKFEPT